MGQGRWGEEYSDVVPVECRRAADDGSGSLGTMRQTTSDPQLMVVSTAVVRMSEGERGRERERVDKAHRAPCDTRRRTHSSSVSEGLRRSSGDGRVDSSDEDGRGGERERECAEWRVWMGCR